MHVTKVYFIQLVFKNKYFEFEDKPNNFYLKNWSFTSFSARRLIKELPTKNEKIQTLDDFVRKLRTTGSIERIVMIDLKCAVYTRF